MEPEPFTTAVPVLPLLKALHLFFLVTWFAALFHLVKLFQAHREALREWEPVRTDFAQRLSAMERRALWWMAWPSLVLLLVTGLWMLVERPALLREPFMHAKLGLVTLLIVYHWWTHVLHRRLALGTMGWSALALAAWAALPIVFLFTLLVMMMVREHMGFWWGVLGLLTIGATITVVLTNRHRRSAVDEQYEGTPGT